MEKEFIEALDKYLKNSLLCFNSNTGKNNGEYQKTAWRPLPEYFCVARAKITFDQTGQKIWSHYRWYRPSGSENRYSHDGGDKSGWRDNDEGIYWAFSETPPDSSP